MRIGRASENDVVLLEHGVSRLHARILGRGGRHFVMDLGSAHGTLLNGLPLAPRKEQELRGGDRLGIGPMEFVFAALAAPGTVPQPGGIGPRSSTKLTRAQTEVEMRAIAEEDTGPHQTVTEEVTMPDTPGAAATLVEMAIPVSAPPAPTPAATLVEMAIPVSAPLAPVPAPRASARAERPAAVGEAMSAAERARLRRRMGQTLGGQLRLGWAQLSPRNRVVAGVATALALVTVAVTLLTVFRPARPLRAQGPEPTQLGVTPLADSFGLGEDVTWTRPDLKAFEFEFISPTRAVVVLHYQASGISEEEVSISLNGAQQGWVPPDTTTAAEREIEQLLAIPLLKRNEPNQLVFDNVRNPPGREPWRVWNMYVEVIPVPELSPVELLAKARDEEARARRFYELRDVGSENLFKAWKHYRFAWLTLEALDEKPELYQDVRFALARTGAELDQQCRRLMLDFQRSVQFRDGDKAVATVEEVRRRFPTTEHRCHNLAVEKALQYDLPM